MQVHISYRQVKSVHAVFATVMCCILLALSGCGNPTKSTIVSSTPTIPGSSPTPLHSRTGESGASTESIFRAQLARVQQIVAGKLPAPQPGPHPPFGVPAEQHA